MLLRSPNREQEALGSLKKCAAANPSGAVKEACLEETVGCLLRLGETMEALATAKLTRGGPSGALAGIVYSHMQGRYAGKAVDLLTRSVYLRPPWRPLLPLSRPPAPSPRRAPPLRSLPADPVAQVARKAK